MTSFGEDMQALVLAGGRSSRMGRDKSLMQIDGKSLIRITLERLIDSGHSVILVMASDEAQEFRQKSSVGELAKAAVWRRDDKPHSGMIEALLTGIRDGAIDATKPLQISSVDSPWLQSKLYSKLRMSMGKNIDIVVPYCKTPHPLHSLVRVDPLNEALNPGNGPLKSQIKAMRWKAVDCTGQGLQNVNSPSDLRMNWDS
ncbi:MAG: molybdenum cofactor guanylyltransferase [Candidatus Thalassarchaeaceae archaeon]